jgi:hypothetical protein
MIKRLLLSVLLLTAFCGVANADLVDALGRLRNSNFLGTGHDQPQTLFDTKQIFDKNPLFWDDQEVSGGGTSSSHSTATAATVLAVSTNTAGVRTRQSFMWMNYQPAKVQHVIQTGCLIASGGGSGIEAYAGQLNDDNGVAFFYDEGTVKTLIRTSTSGSVVNNTTNQSDWDDPMDGTGRSGKTVDWTKGQVFIVSYGWLGIDAVVFSMKIDGEVWVVNVKKHANIINPPYMSTANLPLRWSIENDGTGVASSTVIQCSTIISEGGTENFGLLQYLSTKGTHVDCATENTTYAIAGIRLKSTHLGASINIENITIATPTANGHFEWDLVINPVVTGTFVYQDRRNGSIQAALASGAGPTVTFNEEDVIGGGMVISGGGSARGGGGERGINNARRIGSAIDGTVDTIVLCATPIMGASGIDIEASIDYKELN